MLVFGAFIGRRKIGRERTRTRFASVSASKLCNGRFMNFISQVMEW